MYDATVDKAWPGQKFFGEPERYAQYATDQEGWAITNDDDEFLESRDPASSDNADSSSSSKQQQHTQRSADGRDGTAEQTQRYGHVRVEV